MKSDLRLESFLKLGYFIDYKGDERPIDFSKIDRAQYAHVPRAELIRLGQSKLRETFAQLYDPSKDHVVPISGGLDSRLILAALLELCPAEKLHTYTFGIPGSYDYDLGCLVAKHAGTRHLALPIGDISYHRDELIDFAKRSRRQAMLFFHPPVRELDRRFGGTKIWSGYVGDAVAGSHLHDPPSPTLEHAKRIHIANRTIVRSTRLHRISDEELVPMVSGGGLDPEVLTYDEQVLFAEAVAKFTEPLVLFAGFDYITPLINTPWMDFMFSVPNRFRLGERLMIDLAREAFPTLFGLPTKQSLGLALSTPQALLGVLSMVNKGRKLLHQFVPSVVSYPHTLYNDYDEAIRQSPDVRGIITNAISQLRSRGVADWIDYDGLWRRHQSRLRNHGDALIVLASLELLLRAQDGAD